MSKRMPGKQLELNERKYNRNQILDNRDINREYKKGYINTI